MWQNTEIDTERYARVNRDNQIPSITAYIKALIDRLIHSSSHYSNHYMGRAEIWNTDSYYTDKGNR